jgi:hypothetical protein
MANAKPRALRRKLMRSLDRISKQEEVYHQVLEKKSMDKTSSMYMNSPMSPIRTHHMRPSTTNAMTRSSAWRDVDKEAELFLHKEAPGSCNTDPSSSSLVVGKITLNDLRPVPRASKAYPKPSPQHCKPTLPTTTPVVLPIDSPIARKMTPYFQKTLGGREVNKLSIKCEKDYIKMRKRQNRRDFLLHDPGLTPAENHSTFSIPFLENPKFYGREVSHLTQNADGIKEINHHRLFYCRKSK